MAKTPATKLDNEESRLLAQLPEANPFPVLRLSYEGGPLYMNPAARRFAVVMGCTETLGSFKIPPGFAGEAFAV